MRKHLSTGYKLEYHVQVRVILNNIQVDIITILAATGTKQPAKNTRLSKYTHFSLFRVHPGGVLFEGVGSRTGKFYEVKNLDKEVKICIHPKQLTKYK